MHVSDYQLHGLKKKLQPASHVLFLLKITMENLINTSAAACCFLTNDCNVIRATDEQLSGVAKYSMNNA